MELNFDRPIRLVEGEGSPDEGACWMSAINLFAHGGAKWTDQPPCVCPIIRRLCIAANDALPSDESRGRVIGPVLFEPVGTATPVKWITERRTWHLADAAMRRFAPAALRAAGLHDQAEKLASLPFLSRENAAAARAAAYAAAYAAYAAYAAANAAANAAYAAANAAANAADAAANAAAYAAAYAAYAAANAANAANAAANREEVVRDVVLPVILELCAIGDKRPVEASRDASRLTSVLCQ